jgi:hypothetical protein
MRDESEMSVSHITAHGAGWAGTQHEAKTVVLAASCLI